MNLILKKIVHREAYRIGIYFPYDFEVKEKLKSLGAVYSSTQRCWYFDYTIENYNLLKKNFENLIIENPKQSDEQVQPVAGPESRDLPPIVAIESQKGNPAAMATKSPGKADDTFKKGHKAEQISLAQKLHLQLFDNLGKYWVFKMNYHQTISRELLHVKGIYWNKHEKTFMISMMDSMLAHNLSDSTIRNYGNSFFRFIRDNGFRDPADMDYKTVVRYLGGLMEKGLSATTGHLLVNALNYYYREVNQNTHFNLKLPRPKKECKIRTVFTMDECASIFTIIDNPKHRLALMIAYGAGLRVREVVNLK